MNTFERIYKIVSQIPKGKVLTYGNVGIVAGVSPRVVGYAMHANKNGKVVPCHRVVFRDGSLTSGYAFGGKDVQKKLLLNEGVKFNGEKVNLTFSLFRA
jgi:methylated-DNA-protein-cysteine methyltransferase related protein